MKPRIPFAGYTPSRRTYSVRLSNIIISIKAGRGVIKDFLGALLVVTKNGADRDVLIAAIEKLND